MIRITADAAPRQADSLSLLTDVKLLPVNVY